LERSLRDEAVKELRIAEEECRDARSRLAGSEATREELLQNLSAVRAEHEQANRETGRLHAAERSAAGAVSLERSLREGAVKELRIAEGECRDARTRMASSEAARDELRGKMEALMMFTAQSDTAASDQDVVQPAVVAWAEVAQGWVQRRADAEMATAAGEAAAQMQTTQAMLAKLQAKPGLGPPGKCGETTEEVAAWAIAADAEMADAAAEAAAQLQATQEMMLKLQVETSKAVEDVADDATWSTDGTA
jgi:hypothetical protein